MKKLLFIALLSVVFTSCTKDEVIPPKEEKKEAEAPKVTEEQGAGSGSFGEF